ncbi:hypothetical protein BSKO_04245 [Bryopsis sp. KO-2023]|nr:hypothetical protein BSKO_04245 [Bryopsis sp. KO-2023]
MWPLKVPKLAAGAVCCPVAPRRVPSTGSLFQRATHRMDSPQTGFLRSAPVHEGSNYSQRRCVTVAARKKKEQSVYQETVALPKTAFSLRANSLTREPELQKFWEENKVLESVGKENPGEMFTLHDGPPYANGDLHIGHAMNKILKDFINRYQLLKGKKVAFIPGWDTHGLPIELKVLQSIPREEQKLLTPLDLRKRAKKFAEKTVAAQKEQFKRYGVWADWENPYLTLQPKYEAAQLGVFAKMVANGHIYRGRKPVHWSPSSQTALAEAELEYPEGHTSRSCFVAFQIEKDVEVLKDFMPASLAIWTTTPWTVPANRAVAVNPDLDYALVEVQTGDVEGITVERIIVAVDLIKNLEEKFGVGLKPLATFKGADLEGVSYRHPLYPEKIQPVILGGDYITTETGTGLVHTAPGHGQEDYKAGIQYGLEVFSPVDDYGRFTAEAGKFEGLKVLNEGNKAVLEELKGVDALLKEEPYQHKYPYDWRTKKPIIFRATDQWFASVDGFREDALAAISNVKWVPSSGLNRISAMTGGRSDWCISRQRRWGVPIPAFYNKVTGEPLMTEETISYVQSIVAEEGTDAWWEKDIADLLPEKYRDMAGDLRKGEDTMDVWFDSGTSWAAVLENNENVRYPANLYLEGSDQHRGWFQSSLLTSVATNGTPPYDQVITHGFVLDERGRKMSKSLGNVIDPRKVIEGGKNQKQEPAYGADVLRLWVSSVDYSSDVAIGSGILKQTADTYRKLRGTIRFLLGNLSDFDPKTEAVAYEDLPSIDRYILTRFSTALREVEEAFNTYQFSRFMSVMNRFVVADLSNFYLDAAKDRLYIQGKTSFSRRSCQTVLNDLLFGMLTASAPILPHLAEDAWSNLHVSDQEASVFKAGWFQPNPRFLSDWSTEDSKSWEAALGLREVVTKALEVARENKFVGASMEAKVLVYVENDASLGGAVSYSGSENGVDDMRYLFLTSEAEKVAKDVAMGCEFNSVAQVEGLGEVAVGVARADGGKCGRCWNYSSAVGSHDDHKELCERCLPVVVDMGFKPQPKAVEVGV